VNGMKVLRRSFTRNENYVKIYAINKTGSLFDVDYFTLESMVRGNYKSMTFDKDKTGQANLLETFFKFEEEVNKYK
jgi:hypothetical protein